MKHNGSRSGILIITTTVLNTLAEVRCVFSLQLCRQSLTNTVITIIHSLDPLPFTLYSRWNGPSAHSIHYTQSIQLTPMYCLLIHLNLSQ